MERTVSSIGTIVIILAVWCLFHGVTMLQESSELEALANAIPASPEAGELRTVHTAPAQPDVDRWWVVGETDQAICVAEAAASGCDVASLSARSWFWYVPDATASLAGISISSPQETRARLLDAARARKQSGSALILIGILLVLGLLAGLAPDHH